MAAVDPLASLGICDCSITLQDRAFDVEGHSAADWISILISGTTYLIVPGWFCTPGDAEALTMMVLDDEVSDDDLKNLSMEVLAAQAGRAWWIVLNLIAQAVADWPIYNGRLMLAGINARKISIGAWCDAIYALMTKGMDDNQRAQFDAVIQAPPPDAPIDEIDEGAAFMALLSSGMDAM